jgi:hypothetical protein
MPIAMPQGKNFYIHAEDIKAQSGAPSIIAKVLWKEKRSDADFEGKIASAPAHSVLLALTGLRDKTQEMARAQK